MSYFYLLPYLKNCEKSLGFLSVGVEIYPMAAEIDHHRPTCLPGDGFLVF